MNKTKLRKIINSLWTSSLLLAQAATPVFAQETIDVGAGSIGDLRNLTIPVIISTIIRVLLIAAAIVFFFWLVLGGIRWIMSGGDKARVETARDQVTHALIGLVIVFSAFAIAQLIKVLFGVDLFNLEIKRVG